ncbi:hypothetical protein, partial [Methanococcoides sp. NM1]|uniref:hypothetical protein n=1 Tax=Methanococcoides sp. NM1 TaxID=1201013 RepID=UPI001AEFC2D4
NVSDPDSSYVATGLDEATIYQISTRTVDTDGNINITWINDTATTLDLTAPASVTSLDESSVSGSSITWNWTNPADPD